MHKLLLISSQEHSKFNSQQLKELNLVPLWPSLRAVLPPALVPDHVVMLDALPVTVGGKVDVAALPEPVHATPALAPVADAVDRVVRDAFTLALGHAVGGDDDFFAAGGHSLAAVRVTHAVAQALGVQLTLADLFAAQIGRAHV